MFYLRDFKMIHFLPLRRKNYCFYSVIFRSYKVSVAFILKWKNFVYFMTESRVYVFICFQSVSRQTLLLSRYVADLPE